MLRVDLRAVVGSLTLEMRLPDVAGTTIVVGPNGAGKSTLLQCILGVVRPLEGTIELGGEALWSSSDAVDVAPEHRRIGYVPQRYALFSHMSVADNVGFGVRHVGREERADRVAALLAELGIEHLASRPAPSLSGGEAQRVALARALAIRPRAMLLDEPMAALDIGARRAVRRFLVERLRDVRVPTLVVSHDLDDLEAFDASIVVVEAGAVVQAGTLDDLRAAPANAFVEELVRLPARG